MAKYGVFESTNMKSTKIGRIYDAVATTDIENGTFGYLDDLASGEDVTYNFKAGVSDGNEIVVADNPAWTEDSSKITNQRKDKYIIPAGTRFRVRVVYKSDNFSISKECATGATRDSLAKDTYLTINTDGKLTVSTTKPTGTPAMVAKVERKRITGGTLATAANNWGYAREMYDAKVISLV